MVSRQQEELSDLPGEVSGLRMQDEKHSARGSRRADPRGQRQSQEQAGKHGPELERGYIDKPLDLWRLLSFKRLCSKRN